MTSGVSVLSGVVLAHSATIGMLLALLLHTHQPRTHLSVHGTAHPMSAASVSPRSAADCCIRSAVDISHPRQQRNPRADSSVTSDPVRDAIINGLGSGAVGGGGNPSQSPGRATGTVPSSVVSTSIPLSPGHGLYLPTQRQASDSENIIAPLRASRLAVRHLALMLTTRRPMYARVSSL